MSKNEQIKKLLYANRNALVAADQITPVKKNDICIDGIINEETFENTKKKIIFLLKDTNACVNGVLPDILEEWDYRGWLENAQANGNGTFYSATFNKLCMWTDLFFACMDGNILSFPEYKKTNYNEEHFRNILKKTAIVNLKKTWGNSSASWNILDSYLNQKNNPIPKEVLIQEISIIAPDVVVCGSRTTFDFAKNIYKKPELHIKLPNNEYLNYFIANNSIFLDFYHPSCRGTIEKYYNFALNRFIALNTIL